MSGALRTPPRDTFRARCCPARTDLSKDSRWSARKLNPRLPCARNQVHASIHAQWQPALNREAADGITRQAQIVRLQDEHRFTGTPICAPVRRIIRADAGLLLAQRQHAQCHRVIKHSPARRELRAAQPLRRPGGSQARRGRRAAGIFVPLRAESAFQRQRRSGAPAVDAHNYKLRRWSGTAAGCLRTECSAPWSCRLAPTVNSWRKIVWSRSLRSTSAPTSI